MKKIPSDIHSYISSIQKVEYINQQIIIYTSDGMYVYIPSSSSGDIYTYLLEIDFDKFASMINQSTDNYQLFRVQGDKNKKILFILEELYLKSSKIVPFDTQMKSMIYERCKKNIHMQYQFYYDVQNRIEEMYYPRRLFYNLLLRISDIYHLLNLGEYFLNEWYQSNPVKYREVLTVRTIEADNFWDNKIINVSSARRDYYVYELANYYQMYFEDDYIFDEIAEFIKSFFVDKKDLLLFYALISFVETFEMDSFESEEKIVKYVTKTYSFLSEKYKEYQNTKEEMLEE